MRARALAGWTILVLGLVLGARWLSGAERSARTGAPGTSAAHLPEVEAELIDPDEPASGEAVELVAGAELESQGGRKPLAREAGERSRVRGRVIDVESRLPIPPDLVGVEVREVGFGEGVSEEVRLDPGGNFETRSAFRMEQFVTVRVFELPRKGPRTRGLGPNGTLMDEPYVHDGTELEIEIDPGVLVFVEAVTPDGLELKSATARITSGPGWVPLSRAERPFVLFPNLHPGMDQGKEAILDVVGHSAEGKLFGRSAILWRCGIQSVAITLELEPRVFGRVVDLAGEPVEDAIVSLLPLEESGVDWERLLDVTDAGGRFDFQGLESIEYRLVASGSFARSEPIRFRTAGRKDLGPIVLPAAPSAGSIEGKLIHPEGRGSWTVLLLEDLRSGKTLVAMPSRIPDAGDDDPDEAKAFAFVRVPAGSYSLSAISVDGTRFAPESLTVSPPAERLEFRSVPTLEERFYVTARDAESGEPIPRFTVAAAVHGQWLGGEADAEEDMFPSDRWIVSAAGHRPRLVERSDFESEGRTSEEEREGLGMGEIELRRAQIHLERGFGLPIVFRDGDDDSLQVPATFGPLIGAPLAGVGVLADGELVATSDAEGLALVSLPSKPARLEFALPGWSVALDETEDGLRGVVMIRD